MGRTYTVPRSVKGEGRILYIFSFKSLVTTILGAICGVPFYFLFSIMGLGVVGFVTIGIFAIIGYFIGVLTIPDTPLFGNLRKAGGEKVSEILIRTVTFIKRKKIYIYRPWKTLTNDKNMNKTTENDMKEGNNEIKNEEVIQ